MSGNVISVIVLSIITISVGVLLMLGATYACLFWFKIGQYASGLVAGMINVWFAVAMNEVRLTLKRKR